MVKGKETFKWSEKPRPSPGMLSSKSWLSACNCFFWWLWRLGTWWSVSHPERGNHFTLSLLESLSPSYLSQGEAGDDVGIAQGLSPGASSTRQKASLLSFQIQTHFWSKEDIITGLLIPHQPPPLVFKMLWASAPHVVFFSLCSLRGSLHSWGKLAVISPSPLAFCGKTW